ncbi:hypothetical protein P5G50_01160 [Leifsonia sp. F6_8S_P_1B]|uniref:Uncharacterized protein n=1 Tax=Leifsonia williamsii TaxID=3035919 RepID=A0ABT8K6G8_9MICO|nr:hypothetical protein [Leifsonia williamsii]MDN4613045.1 hypothetical protein [Leifsonia williamsii]
MADTHALDSFVKITGMTRTKSQGLYIYVKRLKTISPRVGIRVAIMQPRASRSTAALDSWAISGAPGSETLITQFPRKIGVFRVVLSLAAPGLYEERSTMQLNAPPTFIATTRVTPALVVSNIVAQHLPGIALMFFPQVKLVKVSGYVIEGWALYKDIEQAFSGALRGCPPLRAGQVITSTSSVKQIGPSVQVWLTTRIWTSQANKDRGLTPACTLTTKLTEYS